MDWKRAYKLFDHPHYGDVIIYLRNACALNPSTSSYIIRTMDIDCLVVRNAMASIFSRKELAISTTRTEQVKIYANELLCAIDGKEYRTNFEKFSVDFLTNLKSTFQCSKPATVPKLKEKVWIQYVEIRANKLPVLWNMFLSSISCPHLASEPLLTELINKQIMEGLLTDTFKVFEEPIDQQDTEASAAVILSKDEENILKYACGYVVKNCYTNLYSKMETKQLHLWNT